MSLAGRPGMGFVYDADSGERCCHPIDCPEPSSTTWSTRQAAYFTDSGRQYMYRVALEEDGSLPDNPVAEEIFLSGDFNFVPGAFNSNGIDATPDGMGIIIVNSQAGELYRVDPLSGHAQLTDLGGESLSNGDGILVDGKTIYVVRNFLNQIAVVEVDPSFTTGSIVRTITDPAFRIPTTVAEFGDALYVVNARFDTSHARHRI
jgi:sugar lactone lactonase YvrE